VKSCPGPISIGRSSFVANGRGKGRFSALIEKKKPRRRRKGELCIGRKYIVVAAKGVAKPNKGKFARKGRGTT